MNAESWASPTSSAASDHTIGATASGNVALAAAPGPRHEPGPVGLGRHAVDEDVEERRRSLHSVALRPAYGHVEQHRGVGTTDRGDVLDGLAALGVDEHVVGIARRRRLEPDEVREANDGAAAAGGTVDHELRRSDRQNRVVEKSDRAVGCLLRPLRRRGRQAQPGGMRERLRSEDEEAVVLVAEVDPRPDDADATGTGDGDPLLERDRAEAPFEVGPDEVEIAGRSAGSEEVGVAVEEGTRVGLGGGGRRERPRRVEVAAVRAERQAKVVVPERPPSVPAVCGDAIERHLLGGSRPRGYAGLGAIQRSGSDGGRQERRSTPEGNDAAKSHDHVARGATNP
jgi:hypothetical protein